LIRSIIAAIESLPQTDRQTLAGEVLPPLSSTRAGLQENDRPLEALSDADLDAVVERAHE
jgi:hypothetical protein